MVADVRVAKYVLVSVSKLRSLLVCCNLNWTLLSKVALPCWFAIGNSFQQIVTPHMWPCGWRNGVVVIEGLGCRYTLHSS